LRDWAVVGDAVAGGSAVVGMRRWACWDVLVVHSCWHDASATIVDIAVADSEPLGAGGFASERDSAARATFDRLASRSASAHAAVAVGELDDCERKSVRVSFVPRPDAAAPAKIVAVARSDVRWP